MFSQNLREGARDDGGTERREVCFEGVTELSDGLLGCASANSNAMGISRNLRETGAHNLSRQSTLDENTLGVKRFRCLSTRQLGGGCARRVKRAQELSTCDDKSVQGSTQYYDSSFAQTRQEQGGAGSCTLEPRTGHNENNCYPRFREVTSYPLT